MLFRLPVREHFSTRCAISPYRPSASHRGLLHAGRPRVLPLPVFLSVLLCQARHVGHGPGSFFCSLGGCQFSSSLAWHHNACRWEVTLANERGLVFAVLSKHNFFSGGAAAAG